MIPLLNNYGLTSWHYQDLSCIVHPGKYTTTPTMGRWPVLCTNGFTCSNKVTGVRWLSLHVPPNRRPALPNHLGKRMTTVSGGGLVNSLL